MAAKKPMKKAAKKPMKKVIAKKPAKKAARPAAKAKTASPKASVDGKPAKIRTASRPRSSTLSYTQSEFLENLKAFCGLAKRSEAKELAEDLALLIKETLRRGYKIPVFGLGKLYVRQTKARTGRNPQTGQEMQIPARKRVRFTAAKALKEAVL